MLLALRPSRETKTYAYTTRTNSNILKCPQSTKNASISASQSRVTTYLKLTHSISWYIHSLFLAQVRRLLFYRQRLLVPCFRFFISTLIVQRKHQVVHARQRRGMLTAQHLLTTQHLLAHHQRLHVHCFRLLVLALPDQYLRPSVWRDIHAPTPSHISQTPSCAL